MTGERAWPLAENPYVGPFAFDAQRHDYFFGRDEEIAILVGLVMARRATLFFAQSGAGKSSLLNAGLIPEVTRQQIIQLGRRTYMTQKMRVLPIVNVGGPSNSAPPASPNLYIFNVLNQLSPTAAPALLAGLDLSAGLAQYMTTQTELPAPLLSTTDSANATLLIFDQFEELFTTYVGRRSEQANLFQQVNQALATYANLHVLFTMREDYIAELTPYANLLPEQLRHRYRLERLKRPAALLAVREPAMRAGRRYADGVAESLVDNLARTQIRHVQQQLPDDSETPLQSIGDEVEPVHLQIVCQQLWANLLPDHLSIETQDVQEFGDVDRALGDFYTTRLQRTVEETGINERHLRAWFNEQLITPAHTRGLVYRDDGKGVSAGLPNTAVDQLRDLYLIRANLRGGDTWYELAHDRLIEPILAANQAWLRQYDNPLLVPTQFWLANNRDRARLLRDPQLSLAQQFANAHADELLTDEHDFLDESLELRTEEQQTVTRRRTVVVASLLIGLLLLGLSGWIAYATIQTRARKAEAELLADQVRAGQLAAQSAFVQQSVNYDVGLLLAIEAGRLAPIPDTYSSLHTAFTLQGRTVQIFSGHQASINQINWSPDGLRLLTTSEDGTARIWRVDGSGEPMILNAVNHEIVSGGRWNPDGMRILTYGEDGFVRIWNATTGQQQWTSQAYTSAVTFAAWDPTGTQIASVYDDGRLRLWNTKVVTPILVRQAHVGMAAYVGWNQTAHQLITTGWDNQVRIWDALDGMNVMTLTGHTSGVQMALWNQDENRVLTAGWDNTARIWDVTSGTQGIKLQQLIHNQAVVQATWSPDQFHVLTASWDNIVRIWNDQGVPLLALPIVDSVNHFGVLAEWSPDGAQIVAASDETARVWNAHSGASVATLRGHTGNIKMAAWNSDSTQIATASEDGTARLWELLSGGELPVVRHTPNTYIYIIQWDNKTGAKILTAGEDGLAYVWDANTGRKLVSLRGHTGPIWQAVWNTNQSLILTAGKDGAVRLWDANTGTSKAKLNPGNTVNFVRWANNEKWIIAGSSNFDQEPYIVSIWDVNHLNKPLLTLEHQKKKIETARWSHDYTRMVTASDDGTLCFWKMPTGQLESCPRHSETITDMNEIAVRSAEWSADDSLVLSYSDDSTARLWDTQTEKVKFTFSHGGPVKGARWNKDQSLILTASEDGNGRIWNAKNGILLTTLSGHVGPVRSAVWNKAETQILTSGDDGTARVWDVNGKLLVTLLGHSAAIEGVSWSPDESMILTYSDDHTARLWDAKTGNLISVLTGHTAPIRLARWNPTGTRILTASDDGTVRQYYVYMEDLLRAACRFVPRNLTFEEWKRYFGNEPYRETCPNLPIQNNNNPGFILPPTR